jgi:hypothetical protein
MTLTEGIKGSLGTVAGRAAKAGKESISEVTKAPDIVADASAARHAHKNTERRGPVGTAAAICLTVAREFKSFLELPQNITKLAKHTAELCELTATLLTTLESVSKPLDSITKPPAKAR